MKPTKKYLLAVLCLVFFLILVGLRLGAYFYIVDKQLQEHMSSIKGRSDKTCAFIYLTRNDSVEIFALDVATARDVQVHAWRTNLWGSIDVSFTTKDGTVVSRETLDVSNKTYKLHLKAGEYTMTTHFANAFMGGCVVGVNYQQYYLAHLPNDAKPYFDEFTALMEESGK